MLKLFAALTATLAMALTLHGETYLTRQEALSLAFEANSINQRRVLLTSQQMTHVRARLGIRPSRIFGYWTGILQQNGKPGFAVFGNAVGKLMPFDYMIVTDRNVTIQQLEILAYRESHGGQIRMPFFRKQFKGKSPDSPPVLGDGIRNISGATLSCRSLTTAVTRDLIILEAAVKDAEETAATKSEFNGINTNGQTDRMEQTSAIVTRSQFLMDTILTLRISCSEPGPAYLVMSTVFAEVARLETLLSRYRSDSDISRLNRARPGDIVYVHRDTVKVLELSAQYTEKTRGAFDPNYRASHSLPEAIRVRSENEVEVVHPVDLDLGAIAKGYALDIAADMLRSYGYHQSLLNFGGQILALDPPPSTEGWPVQFRSLPINLRDTCILHLANASLATSGNDQRGPGSSGADQGHIVNPFTDKAATSPFEVRVRADHAIEADVWSTALFVNAGQFPELSTLHNGQEAWVNPPVRHLQSPTNMTR